MILLDTNVLIDLEEYWFAPGDRFTASILSRAELALGVARAASVEQRAHRQARLAGLDQWIDWMCFDRAASDAYGVVAGGAAATGARIRNKDALIASQAYSRGLTVMTSNLPDYAIFARYIEVVAPVAAA